VDLAAGGASLENGWLMWRWLEWTLLAMFPEKEMIL
jgi:hypothetical protein